ncbi:MAG: Mur ligase family protein, partial [Parachlamydiales bacterium]
VLKDFSDFSDIEKIIVSPGISPNHEIISEAIKRNIEVIGEIELGVLYLKNRCIGITGTNGKTTLTKLLAHIFNNNNKVAYALGNVGTPLTSYIDKFGRDDIIVLELSSFQLETMKTKFLDAAVIINITPDHLDRYPSFKEYGIAKLNIINCLKDDKKLYTTKKIIKNYLSDNNKNEIKQVTEESENIAIKICLDFGIQKKDILNSIKTFQKDKHRIEFVREIKGISFYNDSKATNVHSVIFAVKKFKKPIILIAGGVDKGFTYKVWKRSFKNKVKTVLAIGQSREKIKNELKGFDVLLCDSLKSAIDKAYALAQRNDNILFSPGCSSFDMFKNYEHRGDEFKKIVNGIEGEKCLEEIL